MAAAVYYLRTTMTFNTTLFKTFLFCFSVYDVYLCALCVPSTHGVQVLNPLELELQAIQTCYEGARS